MQPEPNQHDARRLVKTGTPGIFKRGDRYVVVYRDPQGRQRKRFARTLAEARDAKAQLRADVTRGEYRQLSRVAFTEYAADWIGSYNGRTARGVRDDTRREYRRALGLDEDGQLRDDLRGAAHFFGRMRLAEIEPRDVKRYVADVAARGVSRDTVRLALAPVRALFATAVEEGLIRSNPAAGIRLPMADATDEGADDGERVKALTLDELRRLIEGAVEEWRLLIEFLAFTGLRISEAAALRWRDVDLGRRLVLVRRRYYRGAFAAPKSKYGRRDVPLSPGMARRLWELRKDRRAKDAELVFPGPAGGVLDASTAFRAVKAAAKTAGVPWAGLHTLRHTCATLLFSRGRLNAKQVQAWLGHHKASFTIDTYVHLLPGERPDADFLDGLAGAGAALAEPVAEQTPLLLPAIADAAR